MPERYNAGVMAPATTITKPRTLGELTAAGWQPRTVKQELHDNLLRALANGEELFPGIIGYDDTVIPEV
ncbi:MAG: magnesium chelatase, partial [Dehalococcoidia bacterium]